MTKVRAATSKGQAGLMQNDVENMRREHEELQQNAGAFQYDNPPQEFFDEQRSQEERALEKLLDDLAGESEVQITVHRDMGGNKLEYLYRPDVCDNLLGSIYETLQIEYGKGRYRVQARDANGGLRINRALNVGEPPRSVKERTQIPAARDNGGQSEIVAMMMQMQQQAQRDTVALFTTMQQSQAQMIQAMMNRPEPHHPDGLQLRDVLQLLPTLKDLMGGGQKESGIDLLLKGIELHKELAGNGGGETGFVDILKSGIGQLGAIAAASAAKQPAMPTPIQQARPVPIRQNPIPAETRNEPMPDSPDDSPMTIIVPTLIAGARRNSDPSLYAELVLDLLGDEDAAIIAAQPDIAAQLAASVPALAPHIEWVNLVVGHLRALTDDTETPDDDRILFDDHDHAAVSEIVNGGTTADHDADGVGS